MGRKNINVILDLDNTCIYSHECRKMKEIPDWLSSNYTYYVMDDDYIVCERPGLQDFLDWLFEHFNVMIWSAASPDYVEFIAKNIIGIKGRHIEHIFNSNNCKESDDQYKTLKQLKLLWNEKDLFGYYPFNTLIIDDLRDVTDPQPYNSIRIDRFVANRKHVNDSKLKVVKKQLTDIQERFDQTKNKRTSYKLVQPRRLLKKKK